MITVPAIISLMMVASSSSDDNCCSSDNNNNDDFNSPTVKSTDPSDGDNNVPTDLSEIKVTFD